MTVEVTLPDGSKKTITRLEEAPTPGPETVRRLLGLLHGRDGATRRTPARGGVR